MRHTTSAVVVACLLIAAGARSASAVSADDLVNLSTNGLGDDVLVDLIASDGSVFHLLPDDVLALHRRGLSDAVIRAMIAADTRARQSRVADVPSDRTPPSVVVNQSVVQNVDRAPAGETVVVTVPVVVSVAVPVVAPVALIGREPVYWGFGGRLRPGSWTPPRVIASSDGGR